MYYAKGLELGRGWNKGIKGFLTGKRCSICGRVVGKKEHSCPTIGPWNKGLTKNNDPRVMGVSKALTGIKRRRESVEKSRINAGKRIKEQYLSGERKWWGLDPKNIKILERIRKNGFGSKEAVLKALKAQGIGKGPNRIENFLFTILEKEFPREYRYTGNKQIMIDGKTPDFANINGQKKLILLNGIYWHLWHKKWQGKTKEQVETIERKPYEDFGYKVLHIWEDEIVEEYRSGKPRFFENQSAVIEKIRTFNFL